MEWIKWLVDIILLATIWYSAYRHGSRIGAERAMEEQRKRNRDFEQRITKVTNRVWELEEENRDLAAHVRQLEKQEA